MYEFKVGRCNRSRSHDWTECPFAHPGEKARRRDPRKFHYSGTVCADFRKGHCGKGDNYGFSHGVFECWLHPARYRTEACKDGKKCKRKVCFFAHSSRQLRIVPETTTMATTNSHVTPPEKKNLAGCCAYCHNTAVVSPTSTLVSPRVLYEMMRYEEAMIEAMASLEGMIVQAEPWMEGSGGSKVWMGLHTMSGSGFGPGPGPGPDLAWVNDLLT